MKKTIKDIEKLSDGSIKWFKKGLYYAFFPIVLIVGLKTVDWEKLYPSAPV